MSRLEKPDNNTVPFRRKLPPYTAFIAKLVGIYVTANSVVLMVGKGSSIEMMNSMVRNPELLFVLGILGMTAGLATRENVITFREFLCLLQDFHAPRRQGHPVFSLFLHARLLAARRGNGPHFSVEVDFVPLRALRQFASSLGWSVPAPALRWPKSLRSQRILMTLADGTAVAYTAQDSSSFLRCSGNVVRK